MEFINYLGNKQVVWWMGLKYKTPTIANTKNIIREEKEGPSMLDT